MSSSKHRRCSQSPSLASRDEESAASHTNKIQSSPNVKTTTCQQNTRPHRSTKKPGSAATNNKKIATTAKQANKCKAIALGKAHQDELQAKDEEIHQRLMEQGQNLKMPHAAQSSRVTAQMSKCAQGLMINETPLMTIQEKVKKKVLGRAPASSQLTRRMDALHWASFSHRLMTGLRSVTTCPLRRRPKSSSSTGKFMHRPSPSSTELNSLHTDRPPMGSEMLSSRPGKTD